MRIRHRWLLAAIPAIAACTGASHPDKIVYDGCGHAHNDYEHARPLHDALDAEVFCSVEADIWLVGTSSLLVAHDLSATDPSKTLQSLYLDPLRGIASSNGGTVLSGPRPLTLLIDVKSDATATWPVLEGVLESYSDLFTRFEGATVTTGAVTAIVSGNRDQAAMQAAPFRYAAMDGRLADLASNASVNLIPLVSDSWIGTFTWFGDGPIPADQKALLDGYAAQAHAQGRRLRFYTYPDLLPIWREEAKSGVDLINADDLQGLKKFLQTETKP
jgi:glycerophosphoryl diester phosphodiesterase